jgi:hypothetical protein
MDTEQYRDDVKQSGIHAMREKNYGTAIRFFNLWQNSYPSLTGIDKYIGDDKIIDCIEATVPKYRNLAARPALGEKIRIAYLLNDTSSPSAIAAKILLNIIRHHDRNQFEIRVFTTDSYLKLLALPGRGFIRQFREAGCRLHFAPSYLNGWSKVKAVADDIHSYRPHILVTCAALADFGHYFISAMEPAPIQVGFVWGTPSLFISKYFDHGITWIDRIARSCPVPCLNSGITYVPEKKGIRLAKSDNGIPDDAVLLVSAGRKEKFQDYQFWSSIIDTMIALPDLHVFVVGALLNQIPPLKPIRTVFPELNGRIHTVRWSDEYEKYLSAADIYLDTFPGGGGLTLMDAALQEVPVVSFTDETEGSFDQSNWNPAGDIFKGYAGYLVPRDDLDRLTPVLGGLYQSKAIRISEGMKGYTMIQKLRQEVPGNIKKIESLYERLVQWGEWG